MTAATWLATVVCVGGAAVIVASYAVPVYWRHRDLARIVDGLRAAGFTDEVIVDLLGMLRVAAGSSEGRVVIRAVLRRCGYEIPECLQDRRAS